MTYASEVTADTPDVWWRLNETSGTAAADASGNSVTGLYAGGPTLGVAGLLNGDANKAATFLGSSTQGVSATTSIVTLAAATVEALWKSADTGYDPVVGIDHTGAGKGIDIHVTGGQVVATAAVIGFGGASTDSGALLIDDDAAHHLAATWDGTILKLYVDGTNVASDTPGVSAGLSLSVNPVFWAGTDLDGDSATGTIDEPAIYPTALSGARIAAHATASGTPWGGPPPTAFTLPVAGFTFGANAVTRGQATVAQPTAAGTQTRWSVVSVDMQGNVYAYYPSATVLTYTETVNQPEVATFDIPIDAPHVDQLPIARPDITPFREVQIWRNGHLLFWGPPTTRTADSTARVYHYTAKGPLWYLQGRNIGQANRVNFLQNGNFASGTGHWSANGPDLTASIDTGNYVEGTQSLKLVATASGDNYEAQQVIVVADPLIGYSLFITGWVYVDEFVAGAIFNLGLFVHVIGSADPNQAAFVTLDNSVPLGTWTRASAIIHMPPGEVGIVEVRCYCPQGTVHWGGVTMTVMQAVAFGPGTDQGHIVTEVVKYLEGRGQFATFYGVPNGKSDLALGVDSPVTGVKKSRVYQDADHQPGYQGGTGSGVIDEFLIAVDGLDIRCDLTPTTRTVRVYYPRVGQTFTDLTLRWVNTTAEPGPDQSFGIVGWAWEETIESPCANNIVELSGWGTGPDREEGGFTDPSTLAGLTLETVESVPTNTPIDLLNSIAAQRGALLKNAIQVPTLTLAEPRDKVTNEVLYPLIGVLRAGDKVPVELVDGDVAIQATMRFVQVSYDATQETLTVVPNTPS